MEIKLRKVIVNVTLDGDNYSKGDRDITGGHLFSGVWTINQEANSLLGVWFGGCFRAPPPPHIHLVIHFYDSGSLRNQTRSQQFSRGRQKHLVTYFYDSDVRVRSSTSEEQQLKQISTVQSNF